MAAHNRRKAAAEAEEAKKRSSSDEEDEESDTESSEGDKNNQPPPPKKQSTSLTHHSSSDDDDTESESEIDLQSNSIPKSAPEVKLVSSKKIGEPSQASKKPRSKPSTDVHPSGVSSKRPADSPAPKKGNESKRAKKNKKEEEQDAVEYENLKSTGGDDAKKQLFQRIWSEDDEIVILKGMIEYGENHGIDPASVDMNSFFDFIIKSLHVDASKSQLSEKIRRLKKKYQTNLKKSKNDGDRTFAKPHDQTCYDLSKKVWGIESNGSYSAAKVSKKGKNVDANAIKKANFGSPNLERRILPNDETKAKGRKDIDMDVVDVAAAAIPSKAEPFYNRQREPVESSLGKEIVKYASQLITCAKKLELDEKLKQLQMKEIEVYLQRLDYMHELSTLVLEALKANTD